MSLLTHYLPFSSHTTTLQAITYLLFISLFSISFLVFLNSSISFIVTDLLSIHRNVGDIVGTLGFADEVVALVACPFWGLVSDRLGVRWVCVLGYGIVGASLFTMVQVENAYPQLLVARCLFSVGGAATATMVTAVLPSMTGYHSSPSSTPRPATPPQDSASADTSNNTNRHSAAFSTESDITITPATYSMSRQQSVSSALIQPQLAEQAASAPSSASSPPRLAGIVGLCAGCGALLALGIFLPLPAQFSKIEDVTPALALQYSFYVVGIIAVFVSAAVFVGLRNLAGEEGKGWRRLFGRCSAPRYKDGRLGVPTSDLDNTTSEEKPLPFYMLLAEAAKLGVTDHLITLSYLGGFVARASSVAISLFIPLFINSYFISHGFCRGDPRDQSPEMKKECRAAYILSAEVTGGSQLIALLCAPVFGYLSDRYRRFEAPLIVASACGITGYVGFANLHSPELKNIDGRGGGRLVLLWVALIGISQMGAIVCSLGLLGRVVQGDDITVSHGQVEDEIHSRITYHDDPDAEDDAEGLVEQLERQKTGVREDRVHLKGSIAGIYSLSGGAAILLLTKLGGKLFDSLSRGAPFYMMAIFNAVLGVACVACVLWRERKTVLGRNGAFALI